MRNREFYVFLILIFFTFNWSFTQNTKIGLTARLSPNITTSSNVYYDVHLQTQLYKRHSLFLGIGKSFKEINVYTGTIGYRYSILKSQKIGIGIGVNYLTYILANDAGFGSSYVATNLEIPISFEYSISNNFSIFSDIGYSFQVKELFDYTDSYESTKLRAGLGLRFRINN